MCNRHVHLLSCLVMLVAVGAARGELVGHWKFDEGGGAVAADSSGKGNDGTFFNNPTWIDGVLGAALEFHGLGLAGGGGDYVDCGSDASLDITSKISIALWIRPDADDPEGNVTETAPMAKALSTASPSWSWQVRYGWGSPQPFMAFTFNTSPRAWAYVGRKLERYEWCHIACSHDGTTLKAYLNGEPAGETPMGPITSSPTPVLIGSDGWGCDWIGGIDDVRVYNHGLTWDEVAALCPPSREAKNPEPADGAVGVQTPLFRWEAGYKGVMHEVYLSTSPDLGPDDLVRARQPVMMYWHLPGLEPGVTYYWRVDEIEADGVTVNTGNVWSFTTQALTAYLPSPADGAPDVSPTPTLSWQPGQTAVKHHVYLSDSFADVNDAAAGADKGEVAETTFSPGALEPVTTYYWRVDETIPNGDVRIGPVWTFTTYLPIEDFESYTDDEGSRIYETWIDGYTNGNSGSIVGYIEAPFAEQQIVHGGAQSMPLEYNNVDAPFYSEAEREFNPVQDWTIGDVNTLVIHFRGRGDNSAAPLYVAVEDASRNSGIVVYPDPNAMTRPKWVEWRIPFSEFTAAGVNMTRVKMMYIGLGDKADPQPDGHGLLYVDDIYAIKP